MKVIILCGGIGTRLREETEYKPKPMVFIGSKPLIWHIMKIYSHFHYNEFILALGYKADYIKDFFLNQKAFTTDFTLCTKNHKTKFLFKNRTDIDNFKITFVDTGLETLPGERILRCKKYIPEKDKYFMVTYGDGIADIDINTLVKFHYKQKTIGTITGVHPRSKFGLIHIKKTNLVNSFEEKPTLSDWVNGGFMVFKKQFFNYINNGESEHPSLIKLAGENQLSCYKHTKFWYAVDTYKELDYINNLYNSGKRPWMIWK